MEVRVERIVDTRVRKQALKCRSVGRRDCRDSGNNGQAPYEVEAGYKQMHGAKQKVKEAHGSSLSSFSVVEHQRCLTFSGD